MELMTALTIAGILLAMAVPSFTRLLNTNRVADQTNELVGALTLGRSESIRRNANVTLCRVASATDEDCLTGNGSWVNWILRTNGAVLRRGTFQTFGNSLHVNSNLTDEQIQFSSDGLARTGGVLVGSATDPHVLLVCSGRLDGENARRLTLGASSRITTTRETATCT